MITTIFVNYFYYLSYVLVMMEESKLSNFQRRQLKSTLDSKRQPHYLSLF